MTELKPCPFADVRLDELEGENDVLKDQLEEVDDYAKGLERKLENIRAIKAQHAEALEILEEIQRIGWENMVDIVDWEYLEGVHSILTDDAKALDTRIDMLVHRMRGLLMEIVQ